ncbi:SDR family NAD(P)-dependent oxidoreductase [Clostridium tertium]|uniref:SDR family NAD(P)-dependent oxidoreductase n=1 Tax=Clostridium tertium TaxID=1559 RepID=UPI0024B39520|nr:3-oxoacyl-ACP reductase family protein [Clostridium tertium]MDI9216411.1 3-oxoacyl-ACP reductase FabG [Clostridium tertium]
MISLCNKVALVTGASNGIGRATAIMLAEFGADVFVHYNSSEDAAQETAKKIMSMGRKAHLIKADISNHEEIKEMFSYIKKKSGKLDILVNNAGIARMNYINYMKEEEWDEVIDTNIKGTFLCCKYGLKLMIKSESAKIVNVSSDAAFTPGVRQINYVVSKSAIISMTRAMAKEVGVFGICVNAVAPGPIKTDLNRWDDEEETRIKKLIPLQRIGEPDDVAKVITFLCSSLANYISGQVIQIDGGIAP